MNLRTLAIFLTLSGVIHGLALDGNAPASQSIPPCSELGTNPLNKHCFGSYLNGSIWQEFPAISHRNVAPRSVPPCCELGTNLDHELCWGENLNATSTTTHLSRRDQEPAYVSLPERSEPIPGVWAGGNTTSFCIRDGPNPREADIKKLCANIDDNVIVARTKTKKGSEKDGACFCKKFHEGTAWFKACNCDRCDRLEVLEGLRKMCKASTEICTSKGFSGGFVKLEENNGLLVQYNVVPADAKSGRLDRDPMKDRKELTKETCLSKNENKSWQDYTGPVEECWRSWKTFWIARKCHDHSKDTAQIRSPDYWHNKVLRKFFQ